MYDDFIKRDNIIAVVGVSNDMSKWGYKIYKHLKNNDFSVFPVNPKESGIDTDKCYPNLTSIPEKPTLVITVVRPEITEFVVKDIEKAGIKCVWMQPSSESRDAIVCCKEHWIEVVYESCYVVDGLKENW